MVLELLASFLKITPILLIIVFSSYLIVRIFKIEDELDGLLAVFLITWAQIILSLEIFSIFSFIYKLPLTLFYIAILLVLIFIVRYKKMDITFDFKGFIKKFSNFFYELNLNKALKVILISWMVLILFVTFLTGVSVPPNNWDSMAYHLTRAGFWNQHHNINHYFTRNVRQLDNPMNAELGIFWIILFTNSDNIVFLVQWTSFIIILLSLYKIFRILGFNRELSFISVFITSTLDILILESSTTQNDLFITCFLLISIYFVIRIIQSEKIHLPYLVLAGIASGITIGAKGYSYLFIPGLILFFFIYGKNDILKLKKFLYLCSFVILGVFLFASYNFVQNFLSFGNIFGSKETMELMRVKNPSIKSFISNISRHLASFYQFKDHDFGFSNLIMRALNGIHNSLKIDISARSTTINPNYFYLRIPIFNCDGAYFGPIFLFIGLPAIIYNCFYYLILKSRKRLSKVKENYFINTLKFSSIPILYFLGYNYIFVWQPWAGRLLIAFSVLMMVNFAMLLDFKFSFLKRTLVNTFLAIIIFISIVFSFINLFFNEFAPIIPYKDKSIFSLSYDDRRYYFINPEFGNLAEEVNKLFKDDTKLGLLTGDNDWDYIYFGKNFKRNLRYINDEEYKNSLNTIFKNNNFDGIIVNDRFFPDIYEKMFEVLLCEIDYKNYQNFLIPINDCNFQVENQSIKINSSGEDPYFEIANDLFKDNNGKLLITIDCYSDREVELQVFYRDNNEPYSELKSQKVITKIGENKINFVFDNAQEIKKIRIDPYNIKCNFFIKDIKFRKFSDDRNFDYKSVDNFLILYNLNEH